MNVPAKGMLVIATTEYGSVLASIQTKIVNGSHVYTWVKHPKDRSSHPEELIYNVSHSWKPYKGPIL